jgi:hypothetical protein
MKSLIYAHDPSIDPAETKAMAKTVVLDLIAMSLVTEPKEVVSVAP